MTISRRLSLHERAAENICLQTIKAPIKGSSSSRAAYQTFNTKLDMSYVRDGTEILKEMIIVTEVLE